MCSRFLDGTEISEISNSIKNLELNDARLDLKMHANIISAKQSERNLRKERRSSRKIRKIRMRLPLPGWRVTSGLGAKSG